MWYDCFASPHLPHKQGENIYKRNKSVVRIQLLLKEIDSYTTFALSHLEKIVCIFRNNKT